MEKNDEVALVEKSNETTDDKKEQTRSRSKIGAFLRVVFLCLLLTGSLAIFVCWHYAHKENASKIILEDLLKSSIKPQAGNTIFFHKKNAYSGMDWPGLRVFNNLARNPEIFRLHLTPHEACAIESAALHNPDQQVFVLYDSPVAWVRKSKHGLMANIRNISNVNLRSVDVKRFIENSPFENLTKLKQDPRVTLARASEYLGFLSLWHYGGTYLSMDTLTLRNFDELGLNFAVIDKETQELTTKIFNFAPVGTGHYVMKNLCRNIVRHLRKICSGIEMQSSETVARKILTDMFQGICLSKKLEKLHDRQLCFGLRTYGDSEFLGFPSKSNATQYREFFKKLDEQKRQLYAIHGWEDFESDDEAESIFSEAYSLLAKDHCPKTYAFVQLYERFVFGVRSKNEVSERTPEVRTESTRNLV